MIILISLFEPFIFILFSTFTYSLLFQQVCKKGTLLTADPKNPLFVSKAGALLFLSTATDAGTAHIKVIERTVRGVKLMPYDVQAVQIQPELPHHAICLAKRLRYA